MSAMLRVEGLTRRFGGLVALKDLSFEVQPGEIVGLIGPNGAGKTTAFNLISGTLPPSSGRILFQDKAINGGPPNAVVRLGLARTFQNASVYRSEGPVHLRPVGETEKVVALARAVEQRGVSTRVCEGIVAYADLTLGEAVDEVLEAHAQTGAGRLRGIRCGAARHKDFRYGMLVPPPLHLYADSAFRRGFARLARHGLSFESWAFHTQMDELLALAKDHPDTLIVINHVGTPVGVGPYAGRLDEAFVEWASALGPLAALPNTCLKIGGFGMTIFGFDFHLRPRPPSSVDLAQAWRPYVEKCLELFGADRCMFESNFPVDKGTCSYAVLWNAFKRLASGASADEKMQLFRGTAARVYRLKP